MKFGTKLLKFGTKLQQFEKKNLKHGMKLNTEKKLRTNLENLETKLSKLE